MPRRLTRNRRSAVLGGVAAGFADYFNMDPVLARLAFVLLALADGVGLLLYVICWAIIPPQEDTGTVPGEASPGTWRTSCMTPVRAYAPRANG